MPLPVGGMGGVVSVPGSWPHIPHFDDMRQGGGAAAVSVACLTGSSKLFAGESRALVVRGEPGYGKPRQSRV